MSQRLEPPRSLAWLAARIVPRLADDDALLALSDRYSDRAHVAGTRAANRWYLRQLAGFAVTVPVHYLASVFTTRRPQLDGGRSLAADARYSLRMLRHRPTTTALAVVALSLGIGLTATMFSIVNGVVLRGLPFDDASRLMYVGPVNIARPGRPGATSLSDFAGWRAQQAAFEGLAGFSTIQRVVTGGLAPNRYRGALVTPNTFRLLRTSPVIGRDFIDADGAPDATPVIILSHRLWRAQFGADPLVINQLVRVGGIPTVIVGVMPDRFGFPEAQDFWQPYQLQLTSARNDGTTIRVIGRLKPGRSLDAAQAELAAIAANVATTSGRNEKRTVRVIPLIDHLLPSGTMTPLLAMLVAVLGVMLIACSNVTNLQLARMAERAREVGVRTALGASRGRIVRQLLLEGAMLAGAGAALGFVITDTAVTLFNRAIADTDPPFFVDVRIDLAVVVVVTLLTGVAVIVSTLLPALRATGSNPNTALQNGAGLGRSMRLNRFARWLVVGEVLTSSVLLVVSGMMIKSIVLSAQRSYSFPAEEILVASLTLDDKKHVTTEALAEFYGQAEERLDATPGVRRAALASGPPPALFPEPIMIEGREVDVRKRLPLATRLGVSPGFFEVMHAQLIQGRFFNRADTIGSEPVVIVDDLFVKRHFPAHEAVGKRIRAQAGEKAPWLTIIGVVSTLDSKAPLETQQPAMFVPLVQAITRAPTVLAAGGHDPLSLIRELRSSLQELDEDAVLVQPRSLADHLARDNWRFRVAGGLFLSFGIAAMVLAAAGLYGVMAFDVRRRTQEIGVRFALGASRGSVVRMILSEGLTRVGIGVCLGLVPAWGLATLLSSWIYSTVSPTDFWSYAVMVLLLFGTGFCASVIPARRAAIVDPIVAVRTT